MFAVSLHKVSSDHETFLENNLKNTIRQLLFTFLHTIKYTRNEILTHHPLGYHYLHYD